jgi:hypothetical protein
MYGLSMIERQCALEIRDLALKAVSELSDVLEMSRGRCLDEEYERIRNGVGLAIGTIQSRLLDIIKEAYPDLDDVR